MSQLMMVFYFNECIKMQFKGFTHKPKKQENGGHLEVSEVITGKIKFSVEEVEFRFLKGRI